MPCSGAPSLAILSDVCARRRTHTFARTQIGLARPTAVDRRARSTCTPASVGLAHRQRLPGLPCPRGSRRTLACLARLTSNTRGAALSLSASAYHTRIRCTPMLRNEGRGLLGCYGFALLSFLSPSRSPSAAACSDKGSGCSVSTADVRALPFISHSSANALSALQVRELHSLLHSL